MTVAEGLVKEEEFFKDNYPDLIDYGNVGTTNLVNRLSNILGKNIQSSLPDIIKELWLKIDEFNTELKGLGTPMPENNADKI